MSRKQYLCMDIGGTSVKYGVLTHMGEFIFQDSYRTRLSSRQEFLSDLANTINEMSKKYAIEKVGISFPGFINPQTGFAEFAGAIAVLHGTNIKEQLEETVDLPILIENDANCATLAEKLSGNAVGCDHFICMTIGTGIGGGIVVNGKLVNGHSFKAGEFGLMIVDGMRDGYQTMHEIASTSALIHQFKQLKHMDDDCWVDGEQVFQEAETDVKVRELLDQWFASISYGIFNLATVLNPERILIGGAISVRSDLYENLLVKLNNIPSWHDIQAKIVPCKHHNDAGILGALYKCLEEEKYDK
ncbi:ROK family protein [Gracilibacillus sp. JCM 18860]|uniref:ROK family protein n=1 Tax=Gracilibacillus sp. JCM 18860 TaxID=1306159 RepID=UPI000B0AD7DE